MMNEITIEAYGKINLALDVTGRRDDGYHLVRMIMQTVGISDKVAVCRKPGRRGITVSCSRADVPVGCGNIAWKAADEIMTRYDLTDSVDIYIQKNIPMAAGMAGGSADGAAVIKAMNELYELNMSVEDMDSIAVKLGADVPFCLRKGTYLSEGIGEVLTRIQDAPECAVLIVNPGFEVSTAEVYRDIDSIEDPEHPDVDSLIAAIENGTVKQMAENMGNILELAVEPKHDVIGGIKRKMLDMGAEGSMMTGSGPTVFGIFADRGSAYKAYEYFKGRQELGCSFITEFVRQEQKC